MSEKIKITKAEIKDIYEIVDDEEKSIEVEREEHKKKNVTEFDKYTEEFDEVVEDGVS